MGYRKRLINIWTDFARFKTINQRPGKDNTNERLVLRPINPATNI